MHIGSSLGLDVKRPAKRFDRMLKAPLVRRRAVNAHGTPEADDTAANMYSKRRVIKPDIDMSAAVRAISLQSMNLHEWPGTYRDMQDSRNSER